MTDGTPKRRRGAALHVRGRPVWGAWLARLTAHCSRREGETLGLMDVVTLALESHARKKGFRAPPPRIREGETDV